MPRSLLLVGALLAAVLTAACGDDAPPAIEIGAPPDEIGAPVDLDLPEDPSGALVPDQWPAACGLLNDGVIMGVFPQVEEIQRTASSREIELVDENDVPVPGTVTSADCRVELGLPVDGFAVADDPGAELRISVIAAGTPEYVDAAFDAVDGDPFAIDGGDCFVTDGTLSCRTPRVAFSLALTIAAQDQGDDGATSRFSVDGETTEFTEPAGDEGSEALDQKIAFLDEHAVGPLAATIIERLGG